MRNYIHEYRKDTKMNIEFNLKMPKNPLPYLGYEPKSTFWEDFSIADKFGVDAIKDTFNTAFREWKTDVVMITELTMVLNHKIWQWYQKNDAYGRLYDELWGKCDMYCTSHLKGADLSYFYNTTD